MNIRTQRKSRIQVQAWLDGTDRKLLGMYVPEAIEARIKRQARLEQKSVSLWLFEAAMLKLEQNR
jgi:hypothetical protein